ncbi:uncharacterized protein Tco025E_07345 [Trypanosoma conorhini]|uniref:Uncharacterized protein n=1 Tax=Trypanosoma conorhini TaxID=83891 RepID=A0A422NQK9_9TRYP|nr:uncharacterized protein Tco025E_07345 [Trypanosoma conorhini]RNF07669.1 hypothetical protein Tco025E_07345 [Trypanosoma conorhini]
MSRPRALALLLLALLAAAMLTPVAGGAAADADGDADGDASSFGHLEMLEVGDLRQMLHEKQQPFQHLRTKQELIDAIVELQKREALAERLRRQRGAGAARRQHVLRVEYCSG